MLFEFAVFLFGIGLGIIGVIFFLLTSSSVLDVKLKLAKKRIKAQQQEIKDRKSSSERSGYASVQSFLIPSKCLKQKEMIVKFIQSKATPRNRNDNFVIISEKVLCVYSDDKVSDLIGDFILSDCEYMLIKNKPTKFHRKNFLLLYTRDGSKVFKGKNCIALSFFRAVDLSTMWYSLRTALGVYNIEELSRMKNLFYDTVLPIIEIEQTNHDFQIIVNAFFQRILWFLSDSEHFKEMLLRDIRKGFGEADPNASVEKVSFDDFSFSYIAPQITHFFIHSESYIRNKTLDVEADINYDGEITVKLSFEINLSKLLKMHIVGVITLRKLNAQLRVFFPSPPCYCMFISFRQSPEFDVDLFVSIAKVHFQVISMSTISDLLYKIVEDFIVREMVYPNMIPVPLYKNSRISLRTGKKKKDPEEPQKKELETTSSTSSTPRPDTTADIPQVLITQNYIDKFKQENPEKETKKAESASNENNESLERLNCLLEEIALRQTVNDTPQENPALHSTSQSSSFAHMRLTNRKR